MQTYVVARPSMPITWLIQEGIILIQKEVIILEKVGFSYYHSHV